eukprot:11475012-Ditylum_brightwellii.AAC.1
MSIYTGMRFVLGSWFGTQSWFGHGLRLDSDTVFILNSKLNLQSGYVLGLGYGLSSDIGFDIKFKPRN